MKNHILYIMARVEVKSNVECVTKTITDLKTQTSSTFEKTETVKVIETEILLTEKFNLFNK